MEFETFHQVDSSPQYVIKTFLSIKDTFTIIV